MKSNPLTHPAITGPASSLQRLRSLLLTAMSLLFVFAIRCGPRAVLILLFALLSSAGVNAAGRPETPALFLAQPGDGEVLLGWEASVGASGYIVRRASSAAGPLALIATNVPGTSFRHTGLANQRDNYYTVSAWNEFGEGPSSVRLKGPPSSNVLEWLPAGAKVERLAGGFQFTEGPVWISTGGGFLVFSDINANRMLRWEMGGSVTTFRQPSNRANGNTLDAAGRLITCEQTTKRVSRTEGDGSVVTLASMHAARPLNEPNDVVVKSDGTVWFTDPSYTGSQTQRGRYVYRFDPSDGNGTITAVITNMLQPNGLAFSPDETKLYVADGSARQEIRVCDVSLDNILSGNRVFATVPSSNVPDGMRVDPSGRLYVAVGDGIRVLSPDATVLGTLPVPESATNVGFGGSDASMLFITAGSSLYGITRLPDLVVSSIHRTPAAPVDGQEVAFAAVVKNQGTGPVPIGTALRVAFSVGNQTNLVWTETFRGGLGPDSSVVLRAGSGGQGPRWRATEGVHTIFGDVRAEPALNESVTNNNNLRLTVSVAAKLPDQDGDGSPDADEASAGTDPADPASALRIESVENLGAGRVAITWSSVAGRKYAVARKDALSEVEWRVIEADVAATGPLTTQTLQLASPVGAAVYLRILLSPQTP